MTCCSGAGPVGLGKPVAQVWSLAKGPFLPRGQPPASCSPRLGLVLYLQEERHEGCPPAVPLEQHALPVLHTCRSWAPGCTLTLLLSQ